MAKLFNRLLRIWYCPSCGCNPCAQNTPDCDDGYAGKYRSR